jgi:hypothetical protein
MKSRMWFLIVVMGTSLVQVTFLKGQGSAPMRLVFDQAHGEQPPPTQLHAVAKNLGLEVQTSAEAITSEVLDGARILYLLAPSQEFTTNETEAIRRFREERRIVVARPGRGAAAVLAKDRREQPD